MSRSRTAERLASHGMGAPDPSDPLDSVGARIDRLLAEFLPARRDDLVALDDALQPVADELLQLLASGKRLRPAFVYWGFRATGAEHHEGLLHPAAAVELLHAFALVHDDIMDRGEERRGRPTVHRAMADHHRRHGLLGDPDWFGIGAAVLAGDLVFVWADQLLDAAAMPAEALDRGRAVFNELRVEVMAGQYLDLRLAGLPQATDDDALRVALLKSGRYTVTRPLQMGAALAGGDEVLHAALRAYGDAVGVAFQLRDDVLGLYGDPAATGKSAVDDLREGKRTLLMLRALQRAGPAAREVLAGALGNPDVDRRDADRVRQVVADSGALAEVEELLAERERQAHAALAPVRPPARAALEGLADVAVRRSR